MLEGEVLFVGSLFIYLRDFNIIIIIIIITHSCLLLSTETSKVLASVTLGILHLSSCHSILISEHLKSVSHQGQKMGKSSTEAFSYLCARDDKQYTVAHTREISYNAANKYIFPSADTHNVDFNFNNCKKIF